MAKEKIFLQHPKFGNFEGKGKTVSEASKECLKEIGQTLKAMKMPKADIKLELQRATRLIVKKVNKRR